MFEEGSDCLASDGGGSILPTFLSVVMLFPASIAMLASEADPQSSFQQPCTASYRPPLNQGTTSYYLLPQERASVTASLCGPKISSLVESDTEREKERERERGRRGRLTSP